MLGRHPGAERHRLQHLQARDDHPATAGPDGRDGATTLAGYAKQLESDPEEYARLISSLLIKVTEFFRDPKVFDYLREQILPALIEDARHDGRQLRVWSAGCSTGEEAYSLAITLSEAIGDDGPVDVRVFATDIDRDAIAFARRGLYPPAALQNVPRRTCGLATS